jgi:hypothetical protein|nr:MAG TPA: hypothetical protein [Caudoviricetes sp.]
MDSLNEQKGTTVSKLELTLHMAKKALQRVVNENPKAGVIVAKGKKNETRLRYSEAIQVVEMIDDYFAMKGCKSFGICGTCTKFNNKGKTPDWFGVCGGKEVHVFDTCQQHSRKGGGFGL